MREPASPIFAEAVIACLSEGRAPTITEMCHVAQRIWEDGAADRSAFAWDAMRRHRPAAYSRCAPLTSRFVAASKPLAEIPHRAY